MEIPAGQVSPETPANEIHEKPHYEYCELSATKSGTLGVANHVSHTNPMAVVTLSVEWAKGRRGHPHKECTVQ